MKKGPKAIFLYLKKEKNMKFKLTPSKCRKSHEPAQYLFRTIFQILGLEPEDLRHPFPLELTHTNVTAATCQDMHSRKHIHFSFLHTSNATSAYPTFQPITGACAPSATAQDSRTS